MIKTALLAAGVLLTGALGSPMRSNPGANQNFSIETSTVQQDLACFYHNQYPVNTLTYLIPNKMNGDLYNDFKLLTMYATEGDLYLYFYAESNFTFDDVAIEYSMSTTLSADQTEIVEDWHEKGEAFHCDVHDVNGTKKKFYKAVARDFYDYNEGDKHRVKVKKMTCYQGDEYHQMTRDCGNCEYSWQDQEAGDDQVYTYYKDNYLIIKDAKYIEQLIPLKYQNVQQNAVLQYLESNWLFFDYNYSSLGVNYSLGKLKEITIDYEYIDYNCAYSINGEKYTTAYYGGLNKPQPFENTMPKDVMNITFDVNSTKRIETVITPSTKTIDQVTDQATILFFWNITHRINYTYNTIQALDSQSISSIGDDDFRSFMSRNAEGYKWAVDFRDDYRNTLTIKDDGANWLEDMFTNRQRVTTNCHEASEVTAVKFVFENQDGTAELNGLMNPVDISEMGYTSPQSFTTVSFTLGTEENTRNFFIVLGVIAGVALIIGIVILVRKIKAKKTSSTTTTNIYQSSGSGYKKKKPKKHYHKRR